MAIVYHTDKCSGITYVYESISHWDKEKKQSRVRRTLIGRVDKITGEIVTTDGRNRKKKDEKLAAEDEPKSPLITHRTFVGTTFLLDKIGEKLGIIKDLKQCFPDTYLQILFSYTIWFSKKALPYSVSTNGQPFISIRAEKYSLPSESVSYFQALLKKTNKNSSPFRESDGVKMSSGLMI